jgi:sugar lactone lactonase YvrE
LHAVALIGAAASLLTPYDIQVDPVGRLYVADGGRHQIVRWDAATKRFDVVTKSREPTSLAFDRAGSLYFSDVHDGSVRKIDRLGAVTTVATVPGAVGVSVDPTGRWLAFASIEVGVLRVDLTSGKRENLAAVGTGSPLTGPHGLAYGPDGTLWIGDPGSGVYRFTDRLEKVSSLRAGKVVPLRGQLYVLSGTQSGGRISSLNISTGARTVVAGTGRLGKSSDGILAKKAGIMPMDVAIYKGGLVFAQASPGAAIRGVNAKGRLVTIAR